MATISIVLKTLNMAGGFACILAGIFLHKLGFIQLDQQVGSDSFLLVQAHWIAVGAISILVSRITPRTQFWTALLFVWLLLNGWVGGKMLLEWDLSLSWVLAFPLVAGLNLLQVSLQDEPNLEDGDLEDVAPQLDDGEPAIPADFFLLQSPSPFTALRGVLQIIFAVALQIGLLIFFFFYGTLLTRVIYDGAEIEFDLIPEAIGEVFWEILYLPVIIVAVYSIVFLIQIVIEKYAVGRGPDEVDDVNRNLSSEERSFIEEHLLGIEEYISDVKFPAFYGWLQWPVVFGIIGFFIGVPALVVWLELEFFNAVELSRISQENIISVLGPALAGGAIFSFLFASTLYWAVFQWLGRRYRRLGEYLHIKHGWNSMNAEERPLESYAKILTRFVRKRRYGVDQQVSPQQFIHDAYDEFAGALYKVTVALGFAMVIFTALDVNWRRIVHTEGYHYSPYLDWRSYDLTLDNVVEVQLGCFLYKEGDDGERNPGVKYSIVFSNGMDADLLGGEATEDLIDKIEDMDRELVTRGVPFVRAERAGRFILRGIDGFRSDCREVVLPKLDEQVRSRVGLLLRVES